MISMDLIHERVTALQARRDLVKSKLVDERQALATANTAVEDATTAQQVAQSIAQTLQQRAHERVSRVVTRCLAAVFDEPYEFSIQFEQRRGKTEADLVFKRDGLTVSYDEIGGGVVDVAAFALRLAAMVLYRPAVRRVLFLDEAFRFVSKGYRHKVRDLLLTLATEMGVQFIIVTHDETLMIGTVVEIG